MDNIFPESKHQEEGAWLWNVVGQQTQQVGDVLEFGTGAGFSGEGYSRLFSPRKYFTIDHFQGLEQTSKPGPPVLAKGAFRFPFEETKARLARCPNVVMIVEDIHKLASPETYGIGRIAFVNVDVDIYEATKSALEFLSKCQWNQVAIRFDDWHGHESEWDHQERLACKEWLTAHGYRYQVVFGGMAGGVIVNR